MEKGEAEIIVARRTIDKLTSVIADQEKVIADQEKEIASLKGQLKAFEPVVNEWSARQKPAPDDYYED